VLATAVWHGHSESNVAGAGFGGQIPATITRRFLSAQLPEGGQQTPWPEVPSWCNAPGVFLTPAGRNPVPDNSEPATNTPQPTVIINEPPPTTPTTTPHTTIPTTNPDNTKP
jgi:hypothetical protein